MANPKGRLSLEKRSFHEIVSDMRHVVFSVIRDRPAQGTSGVSSVALGTGFFVEKNLFITCEHVMNPAADPHKAGDSYRLIANLTGSSARIHQVPAPEIGKHMFLYPELDLAIVQVNNAGEQASVNLSYDEIEVGEEIGIAGYPLAQLFNDASGNLQLNGLIYRCGRGVVSGRYEIATAPTALPLPMIETNFMFVSGNSGGPVFCPETGKVVGMVKMVRWAKIADQICTADPNQQLPLGVSGTYLAAVLAVYSAGIKLDSFRAALESVGVTP